MSIKANQLWLVQNAEMLSDAIGNAVASWDGFSRKTIGIQLVRAADSVGANIVEGYGRCHARDALRFYSFARGSLEETIYWLRRAYSSNLIEKREYRQWVSRYQILSRSLNKFIQVQTPLEVPLSGSSASG